MATEVGVAQAYIADITTDTDRTSGLGKVGAAHGAGFIIGPAISGFLSIYGFSLPGYAAAALTGINFLFVLFFLPESVSHLNLETRPFVDTGGYWSRLKKALTKPLIRFILIILFIITFAFASIPVIVPLLGIDFFGFTEVEMSYFFMYIGFVQIILQGFFIGRLTRNLGEENLIVFGSFLMFVGVFCMSLIPNILVFIICITLMSSGMGTLSTAIPSFISKRILSDEQGGILGVAQSVGSIARIPGPLVGGLIAQYASLNSAFLVSSIIVFIAFIFGFKIFETHKWKGITNK
jgi:MFS family permease